MREPVRDPDEVWNAIDKDLAPLKEQLERYLKEPE